jgi:hypothetical protein
MGVLGIKTKLINSSDLHIISTGSDRILDICRTLNADVYLSGASGKKYLTLQDFINNDIDVEFMEPADSLSILDWYMNV